MPLQEVAVLERLNNYEPPLMSVAGEIITQHHCYAYQDKYLNLSGTTIKIPAALSEEQLSAVQIMAGDILVLLQLAGLVRIACFLDS